MNDTMLTTQFKLGTLTIWHKSMMGSLNQLFDLGNAYRLAEGKPSMPLANWIGRQSTVEFIAKVSDKLGRPAVERKKGRGIGTYAHLYILLDAAMELSSEFKLEIVECFVNSKLLGWRDESGEDFKDMNAALMAYSEQILGKPAHTGHYVNLSKAIKDNIKPTNNDWNHATAHQLTMRAKLEEKLIFAMSNGLVRDWEHLKELALKA